MQRPGTEAIRTQIQPSKPKRKITNITISQNTNRTYGQLSEQLFPKRWPLSNPNLTNNNMNVTATLTPKTGNREAQQIYRLGTVSNELLERGVKLVFKGKTSPSVSEVVQNIKSVVLSMCCLPNRMHYWYNRSTDTARSKLTMSFCNVYLKSLDFQCNKYTAFLLDKYEKLFHCLRLLHILTKNNSVIGNEVGIYLTS